MGNASRKVPELPDERTGLTKTEVKLIQETWRNFSSEHREFGALLFITMFVKHPEYIELFKHFRGKSVTVLKDEPFFRAHGCSIGYHLTSIVENLQDPTTFEILVRRNATQHLRHKGVKAYQFEVLCQGLVDVQQAKDERHMTPAAIEAWEKFIGCMLTTIRSVYNKAAVERAERISIASAASKLTSDDAALSSTFRTADTTTGEGAEELETVKTSPTAVASAAGTTVTTDVAKKKLSPRVIAKKVDAAAAKKGVQSPKTSSKTASPQRRVLQPAASDREKPPVKDIIPHTEPAY